MKPEEWRLLVGTMYEISSHGRIRRVLLLAPALNRAGYMTVGFRRGKTYNHRKLVHCLVAEAFIGPRPDGHVVNHKNGVKGDNRPENLEYVTPQENAAHAAQLKLYRAGSTHPKSKLTEAQVRAARKQYQTGRYTFAQLAIEYGVTKATIHKAIQGVTYSAARA